ncbi:hypothetical protein IID10_17800, partial [candidate division KSB1 bacterium]|nr:hypothetical protein [candidate division KSB1 bacterium]
ERLAFLYRRHRVRRADMASDLTIDRTSVLGHFFDNEKALIEARRKFERELARFRKKERKTKPKFTTPVFITFVRTPYVVTFEAPAANDAPPLRFTAVNAHLVYGAKKERRQEFDALVKWLTLRLTAAKRLVAPNFLLLGDLNLAFEQPRKDREKIDAVIRKYNKEAFGDANVRRVYFPFIDTHPVTKKDIRTNARDSQTFDQIGFFRGADERRLPNDPWRTLINTAEPDGFDYGVFNFADLFARALKNKAYTKLTKAEKKALQDNERATDKFIFDAGFAEKLKSIDLEPDRFYHFGTGQSSDALLWGNRDGILDALCKFAADNPNILLEFKTKSNKVRYFLENEVPHNIVCSWSLNPPTIIQNEEHFTANLNERLEAARLVADRGIKVSFHFHPMVYYQGWERDYPRITSRLTNDFSPGEVLFISFGSITLIKPAIKKIRKLGNSTKILQMEMVPDPHGKLTYPDKIKIDMFSSMYHSFQAWHDKVFFYLCMEKTSIWEKSFGYVYGSNEEFEKEFGAKTMCKLAT